MSLLNNIKHPSDIKKISHNELDRLCGELRWKIIETVSDNGGHLSSNLGSVELTVAMLRAFDLEKDEIIWDVGHQAYAYKLLTGRYEKFHTLRKFGGISGYLKRNESKYDVFGAGHSSTSISAAYGIRVAKKKKSEPGNVIALIGDGALTSGVALEALNNIGSSKEDILIILNTNEMSISRNTGAIAKYLSKIITNPVYNKILFSVLNKLQPLKNKRNTLINAYFRFMETLKLMLVPGKFFESLDIRYFGPFDGHDVKYLEKIMKRIIDLPGPKLMNVITKKGLGYKHAYENPTHYHGVSPFNIETGKALQKEEEISCSKLFGRTIDSITQKDADVIAITAAMGYGTGLNEYSRKHPDNFFDVGIEEEHAVIFAGGMAVKGLKPFVAIYSTFLQRAFDMIMHDIAIQELPVKFFLDRSGIVGDDGETHHGIFDISYLRMIPYMRIISPSNKKMLVDAIYTAYRYDKGPIAVRYPRGALPGYIPEIGEMSELALGKGITVKNDEKDDILFITCGNMLEMSKGFAENIEKRGMGTAIFDVVWIKPLDNEIIELSKNKKCVAVFEDNSMIGGLGDAVIDLLNNNGVRVPVLKFGWNDIFPTAGSMQELYEHYGFDPDNIYKKIMEVI